MEISLSLPMKDQFYSKLKGQRHELINGDKIT